MERENEWLEGVETSKDFLELKNKQTNKKKIINVNINRTF